MSEGDEKARPRASLSEVYRLTRDINTGEFNSDELDRQLTRVVHGIALAFLRSEDLDDSFRTLVNLLLLAFLGTHRSMRTLFEERGENPGAVSDAMSLAREQIEKVFVVVLLLDETLGILEKRAAEDLSDPTLAFEGLITRDGGGGRIAKKASLVSSWKDAVAWKREVVELMAKNGRVRPVEVVGKTLVLERVGAAVRFVGERDDGLPQEVLVEIPPRPRPIPPAEVAAVYERVLTERGLPCHEEFKGSVDYELSDYHLRLRWRPKSTGFAIGGFDPVSFPAPQRVGDFYASLLTGCLKELLVSRERGVSPATINLVPAYVAFFLRTYGGIESPKEIHNLLNKHVFQKALLPEGGYYYDDSKTHQLWGNVKRFHKQLVRTMHSL